MTSIASIMSAVLPNTFVPDMRASEAPTVGPIPGSTPAPLDAVSAASALPDVPGIDAIGSAARSAGAPATNAKDLVPSVSGDTTFRDTVKQLLAQVNDSINTSDQNTRDLATGKTNDVNKVVTSVEEANLALQYTMAIRTKLLEAYTSVQTMSV